MMSSLKSIQIVIPHCPGRDAELCRTYQSLANSDWPIDQFPPLLAYDDRRDQPRNALKAIILGVRSQADFVLCLENDVLVNRHLWHNLQTYPFLRRLTFLTLYGCVWPYIQVGAHARLVESTAGWGAQGIMLSQQVAQHLVTHWDRKAEFEHSDLRMFRLGGEICGTWMHSPSLVQHIGRNGLTAFHEVADFDPDWRRTI